MIEFVARKKQRIYAYKGAVDMRKSFYGLQSVLVQNIEKAKPLSGDIYLFINKRGNYLKALFWDRSGFVIISKKLERGTFGFPGFSNKGVLELSEEQLCLIFDGIKL